MKKDRIVVFIILLIVVLGAVARFYSLTSKSIWYGEAATINVSLADLSHRNFFDSIISYKPLFFLLLKGWENIFGIGAFWVRLLPVIFSVISIFMVYLLGKELIGKREGLIAAFFLSVSCFHIYLSQQARHFSLAVFLVLASYLFLAKFLKTGKFFDCFFNTICNIMFIFIHPTGLSIILAQQFFMLFLRIKKRAGLRTWFFAQLFTGVFILIWYVIANKKEMFHNIWWIQTPQLQTFIETFETFAYGGPRYGLDDLFQFFRYPQINMALFAIFTFFLVRGLWVSQKDSTDTFPHRRALLLYWIFVPIIIPLAVSFFQPLFLKKHLLDVLPGYLLAVAIGIGAIRKKAILLAMLSFIFVLNLYPLKIMYATDLNIDWRAGGIFLRDKAADGDIIIVSTLSEINPFLYYFTAQNKEELKYVEDYGNFKNGKLETVFMSGRNLIIGIVHNEGEGTQFVINDFTDKLKYLDARKGAARIWFAASRWGDERAHAFIIETLKNKYKKINTYPFPGLVIYQFAAQ